MGYLDLRNVSKSYENENQVLKDIHFSIKKGEFFVLVGPSGSGKSTLLRMIAGLEDITEGTLTMNGQVVNHLPPKDRHLSMVFQNYALYPHLNVEQNILFGLHAKKVNKKEQYERLHETVTMMGIETLLKRKPRELSGGQRQRVALARAVVSQAPLCLMDEPLSNLDAQLRAHMRVEIRRLQKQLGLTMIYVTHDQVEAMTMGDRIMVLHEGRIQQIGPPIKLYNEPENLFVASFIGSPKMNTGKVRVHHHSIKIEDFLSIALKTNDLPPNIMNQPILVGIRAEHIEPAVGEEKTCELEVVNIEHLGNETFLTFEVGSQLWTAKWIGQWNVRVGEIVPIKINMQHFHFFNGETGKLIKSAVVKDLQEVLAI